MRIADITAGSGCADGSRSGSARSAARSVPTPLESSPGPSHSAALKSAGVCHRRAVILRSITPPGRRCASCSYSRTEKSSCHFGELALHAEIQLRECAGGHDALLVRFHRRMCSACCTRSLRAWLSSQARSLPRTATSMSECDTGPDLRC